MTASSMERGSPLLLSTGSAPTSVRPSAWSRGQSTICSRAAFHNVMRPALSMTDMPWSIDSIASRLPCSYSDWLTYAQYAWWAKYSGKAATGNTSHTR